MLFLMHEFEHVDEFTVHVFAEGPGVPHGHHVLDLELRLEFLVEHGNVLGPWQAALNQVYKDVEEALYVVLRG